MKTNANRKLINIPQSRETLRSGGKIPKIEINSKFFHIPIDSIIQERFFNKNLPAWSKIKTYEEYFWYQQDFRERNIGKIPILEEFREFNKI